MGLNTFFEKIYCINIDRRTDRWEKCLLEFNKHNITVERFSAVDGNITNHNLGYPYDNELAGALSHLNIIKKAKELNLKNVLILEDDVEFNENINETFDSFIKQIPEDWDSINFGGNHTRGFSHLSPNIIKTIRSYALHAYGLNSKSYDFIISYLEEKINNVITNGKSVINVSVAADFFMADLQINNKFYCFFPHIAWQKDDYSDIQKSHVNYNFLKN